MDVVAACLPDSRRTRMSALPVLSAGESEVEIDLTLELWSSHKGGNSNFWKSFFSNFSPIWPLVPEILRFFSGGKNGGFGGNVGWVGHLITFGPLLADPLPPDLGLPLWMPPNGFERNCPLRKILSTVGLSVCRFCRFSTCQFLWQHYLLSPSEFLDKIVWCQDNSDMGGLSKMVI